MIMNRPTDDPKHHLLQLRVSADYLKAIDAYRRLQPDPMPSRSEAVRRLTMIGLGKVPKPKPKKET
jgi:hypothetical protein